MKFVLVIEMVDVSSQVYRQSVALELPTFFPRHMTLR